jgi:GNAT superfamily N-acetyltransferase
MQIRELDPERDLPGVVAVTRTVAPSAVVTYESLRHRYAHPPERAALRALVAEQDGEVVGRVNAFLDFFTEEVKGVLELGVIPRHRHQGIGARLYEAAVDHLQTLAPATLAATFEENADGVRFALAHGFAEARAETIMVVDPRLVGDQPPASFELRPISTLDPRVAFEVDIAATRDVPYEGTITDIDYDEWTSLVLDYPLFAAEGSFVAFVDGEAAAISLLTSDPEGKRAGNMFTGTLAEFRGRGLARAVKLASIRWAAAHGITQIATVNDEMNAGMLAVNRRLGYRPRGRRVVYVKRLS